MAISFQGQRIRNCKIVTQRICAKCDKRRVPKEIIGGLLCTKCMRDYLKNGFNR